MQEFAIVFEFSFFDVKLWCLVGLDSQKNVFAQTVDGMLYNKFYSVKGVFCWSRTK